MRRASPPTQHDRPLEFPDAALWVNRGLFAEHFLNNRLSDLPGWKDTEGLDQAFDAITKLYQDHAVQFTEATNEAQTEEGFIKPVLRVLWGEDGSGDCFEVQVHLPNVDGGRQPDYAFFHSAADKASAQPMHGTIEFWRDVPCLGDAKRWCASLDKERAGENPSSQIVMYLYRSRVRWGILTNGRVWRLYEQDKSRAGGTYFEVDLENILRRGDREAFRYFYLFFRRQAHLGEESFLDQVFKGSADYATGVGDKLKESVYDALRHLMNGFFESPVNGLDPRDPEQLKQVHENSLIVLYRLLFVLYAEDRGLLPCEDEHYKGYSLQNIHRAVNRQLRDRAQAYVPAGARIWGNLCSLFQLIDEGFPLEGRWVIPAYNGGLFSPSRHPHVAHSQFESEKRWQIGDSRLAEIIDRLSYKRERWDEPGSEDIDYTTLQVQHLGSIYEGLLELQPQLAKEALIETTEKGKPVFKPAGEVPNPKPIKGQHPRRIAAGEVYLVTNRGERKATGSYYTPSYIVDYIVEHTAGPLVDEAAGQTRRTKARVDEIERELKRAGPDAAHQLGLEEAELKRHWLEPYLSLHILDPAMGSGHFLVGAADFLSLAMATDPNLPHLEEMGDEDPQAYYKRLVVERCLYGVDLNPLAVELAKLSLWLHTVSRDKALSFLDHHLRCGNSLIGAWIEPDLMKEPPQFDAKGKPAKTANRQLVLGFSDALGHKSLEALLGALRGIMEGPSGSAVDEHAKEALYRGLEAVRERFRTVANSWLAPYFGVPVTPEQYQWATEALSGGEKAWEALTSQEWFRAAQEVAGEHRFFHWELEFPECFFNEGGLKPEGERGFGAVVGNPPYDVLVGIAERPELRVHLDYYRSVARYADALGGRLNIYRLFVVGTFALLDSHGAMGWILPSTMLADMGAESMRRRLLDCCGLIKIVYYPESAKVFAEALQAVVTVVAAVGGIKSDLRLTNMSLHLSSGEPPIISIPRDVLSQLPGNPILVMGPSASDLMSRLGRFPSLHRSESRGYARVYEGELNQTFHKDCMVATETPFRLLRGVHCGRYGLDFGADSRLPYADLRLLSKQLGESAKVAAIYETRIVFQGIANMEMERRLLFAVAPGGTVLGNSVNYLTDLVGEYDARFFLAILNSALLNWRFGLTSTHLTK